MSTAPPASAAAAATSFDMRGVGAESSDDEPVVHQVAPRPPPPSYYAAAAAAAARSPASPPPTAPQSPATDLTQGNQVVVLTKDFESNTAFLFDLANVGSSSKNALATPLSQLAAHFPKMMLRAAVGNTDNNNNNNELKFRRAVAIDSTVDRNDQGSSAMGNLHSKLKLHGIEVMLFTPKGASAGSINYTGNVQRAVDVALGIQLLELADCIRPPTAALQHQQQQQQGDSFLPPRPVHLIVFSSDADLEPAIAMAIERNPVLRVTVVTDRTSTSQNYARWLESKKPRVNRIELASLLGTTASTFAPAANSASATATQESPQQQARNYPDAPPPMQVAEIRRRDAPDAKTWIARIEDTIKAAPPTQGLVLKINKDDSMVDGDLCQLSKWLATSGKAVIADLPDPAVVRQVWIDHSAQVLRSKNGCIALGEILVALRVRELHASHTNLSPEVFAAICRGIITNGTHLYINASSTPAADDAAASTAGLTISGRFEEKTFRVTCPKLGSGSLNARFAGHYQSRRAQRGGGGGRGRGRGRGGGNDDDAQDSEEDYTIEDLLIPQPRRGGRGRGRGLAQEEQQQQQQEQNDPAVFQYGGRGRGRGRGNQRGN